MGLFAGLMSLVLATGAVVYAKIGDDIQTFSESGLSKNRPPETVRGQNILLIGSDSRTGRSAALGGDGEAVGRSDTTLFVHVYEGGKEAVAVSIPRDAMVDIPPCRLPDGSWTEPQPGAMFNSAFSVGQTEEGNPACTVNTVEKLTGMRVDHTVVANFAGFAAMTDIVGGVPVCVPNPIYQGDVNPNLGAQGKMIFEKGMQTVSGQRALDYVRLRHGIGDGSDIGRMRRQQAFVGSAVAKIRAEGMTPTKILPLAEAATKHFTVSPELGSAQKLMSFVLSLRHMSPEQIVFLTTPWKYEGPRVALVHPDVDRLWEALRNDEPLTKAKKPGKAETDTDTVAKKLEAVTDPVTVLNGTGVTGLAGRTGKKLERAGLEVPVVGNAPAEERTVVVYGPGEDAQAKALATAFVEAELRPASEPGLQVVLGTEHEMHDLAAKAKAPTTPLPDSIAKETRSAATNPCKDVSYGALG
jgi:LCP family protein required for cell wall assembly